jgi:aminoglycoside phosphotransferase (APT) family kinase protein
MPVAEVDVDEPLVRALLGEQHSDLANLPLTLVANGWDNVLWRLGDELMVRLPRREAAASLVLAEQRWLPELAPRLPLPVPVPLRVGRPGSSYPWAWSVVAWHDGESALTASLGDEHDFARRLGGFLVALHTPGPPNAPVNEFRGVPLAARAHLYDRAVAQLTEPIDRGRLDECFAEALAAPTWDGPPLWLHGDLHRGNLVMRDGRLSAVIDFGDITAGDPATDLAIAWHVFTPEGRATFRAAAANAHDPIDDATWLRARGWAIAVGLAIVANSADAPAMAAAARHTVAAALSD